MPWLPENCYQPKRHWEKHRKRIDMEALFEILKKIITNVLTAIYEPFGFALLLAFFAQFFYLYAYHPVNVGKGWKTALKTWENEFRTNCFFRKLFLLAFLSAMILFRTLLNRNLWLYPLSDVMGGWGIWKVSSDGTKELTTECFENIILMFPFTSVLMWAMKEKLVKVISLRSIAFKSAEIAFCFSLTIEFLQLFLRLGTFQLSDLCYNTLGGCLGGIAYWIAWKIRHSIRWKKQKLLWERNNTVTQI